MDERLREARIRDHISQSEGYVLLGLLDEALAQARAAVLLGPQHFGALHHLGFVFLLRGAHSDAAQAFESALQVDTRHAQTYVHLAYCYRRTVSLEKAMETIEKAVEMDRNLAIAQYNCGCYCAVRGRRDKALAHLREAIRLNEGFRDVARGDEDWTALRQDQEFLTLVGKGS